MALTAGCVRDRASPHFPQTSKMGRGGGVGEKETKRERGLKSVRCTNKIIYKCIHLSTSSLHVLITVHSPKQWGKLYVENAHFHR